MTFGHSLRYTLRREAQAATDVPDGDAGVRSRDWGRRYSGRWGANRRSTSACDRQGQDRCEAALAADFRRAGRPLRGWSVSVYIASGRESDRLGCQRLPVGFALRLAPGFGLRLRVGKGLALYLWRLRVIGLGKAPWKASKFTHCSFQSMWCCVSRSSAVASVQRPVFGYCVPISGLCLEMQRPFPSSPPPKLDGKNDLTRG